MDGQATWVRNACGMGSPPASGSGARGPRGWRGGSRALARLVACVGLFSACLAAGLAWAEGPGSVRKRAEMSMLVTGMIDIDTDGSVGNYTLDQPDKLPPAVRDLVAKGAPHWRFDPVVIDGQVRKVRSRMSVRVVAHKKSEDSYEVRVAGASFGDPEAEVASGAAVGIASMPPPRYPEGAYRSGIQGTVYLVLKIDRQGAVVDVVDEQVNLTVVGSDAQMRQGRKLLASAARVAGRKWTFKPPTKGEHVDDPFWTVRVPVSFALCDGRAECSKKSSDPDYGTWQAYIPGPRNAVPWSTDAAADAAVAPDSMAEGALYLSGTGPKLRTPLQG